MKHLWQFVWNLLMLISGCGLIGIHVAPWAGMVSFLVFGSLFLAIWYHIMITIDAKK